MDLQHSTKLLYVEYKKTKQMNQLMLKLKLQYFSQSLLQVSKHPSLSKLSPQKKHSDIFFKEMKIMGILMPNHPQFRLIQAQVSTY